MKRTFVLRLTQEAQPVGGKFEGRGEEVRLGQRFASVEEFLSFLQRCLATTVRRKMKTLMCNKFEEDRPPALR
jgi:hypothetical protein